MNPEYAQGAGRLGRERPEQRVPASISKVVHT